MSVLIEKLKELRNRAGCGHPQGWELMRDTMNTAIKIVEAHPQADNIANAKCCAKWKRYFGVLEWPLGYCPDCGTKIALRM